MRISLRLLAVLILILSLPNFSCGAAAGTGSIYPRMVYPKGIDGFQFRDFSDFGLRAETKRNGYGSGFRIRRGGGFYKKHFRPRRHGIRMRAFRGYRSAQ